MGSSHLNCRQTQRYGEANRAYLQLLLTNAFKMDCKEVGYNDVAKDGGLLNTVVNLWV
jgi:hypothetical protein